jgi:hypothetical protein
MFSASMSDACFLCDLPRLQAEPERGKSSGALEEPGSL